MRGLSRARVFSPFSERRFRPQHRKVPRFPRLKSGSFLTPKSFCGPHSAGFFAHFFDQATAKSQKNGKLERKNEKNDMLCYTQLSCGF